MIMYFHYLISKIEKKSWNIKQVYFIQYYASAKGKIKLSESYHLRLVTIFMWLGLCTVGGGGQSEYYNLKN